MEPSIETIKSRISAISTSLDLDTLTRKKAELQATSLDEHFWQDQATAQAVLKEIALTEETITTVRSLEIAIQNITEYGELAKQEHDASAEAEVQKELAALAERVSAFELRLFLSGKYDTSNALLAIHAGQGGTEAHDWAEMLMRMYLRYAEKQGWTTTVLHLVKGETVGITTVALEISGAYAYGYLKGERGTHRLVRLSPFNAQSLRQTSFAGVEVLPVIDDNTDPIEIPPGDLEFKAVRSSGPGGQNVNKTSTAVMITHKPTGIVVHCSTQRSQHQNKESAMKLLKAQLWELEEEKREEERQKIKGEHKLASWGNQIRNYVLHPYKLVKDLRTGVESSNPEAVLDGHLDEFVEAGIRSIS